MSSFFINPALKVYLDKAYAASVPNRILIKLAKHVTKILLRYGSTIFTPP